MLKIRLRRVGKKRTPYYRVVVAQNEAKRDGAFLETLGSYDPHANPPSADLDEAKTKEWLTKGAQPSEAVEKVLRRIGILEPLPAKAAAKGKAGAPAKAAAPAAKAEAPSTAEVAEAAATEGTVEEQAPEPGEDEVSAEAPTAE